MPDIKNQGDAPAAGVTSTEGPIAYDPSGAPLQTIATAGGWLMAPLLSAAIPEPHDILLA